MIISIAIGLAIWYVMFGMLCAMMGATACRSPWIQPFIPFICLYEDVLWLVFPNKKIDYIKQKVNESELGYMSAWSYREIREQNLYKEVADYMLGGKKYFFCMHILLPLTPFLIWLGIHSL